MQPVLAYCYRELLLLTYFGIRLLIWQAVLRLSVIKKRNNDLVAEAVVYTNVIHYCSIQKVRTLQISSLCSLSTF